jgi:cell division protein FtsI (penicillin-binding protein 3)
MAAPSTGRRRQTGRRGALGSPKPARNGTDGRIRLLRLAFVVFLVLVGGKAVALASSSQHLAEYAVDQQTHEVALPAPRGSILDRNGDELAVGKPQQTVFATPYLLDDPRAAADELCDALQINRRRKRRAVEKDLVAAAKRGDGFCYVARKVDPDYATAAVALGIPGVGSYAEEERMYPLKGTAAQVVGFAGMDNQGLAGIELVYDEQLSGKPGSETIVRDPAGHALKTMRQKLPAAGSDVRLTLDSEIQYTAEDVLEKTVRSTGGKSAMGIVMDPRTGEILAMANVTGEGFHGFGKDKEADKNRCITDVYEPGSIFKVVTISGALADGTVTPEQKFTLPPSIWVSDREINESHPRGTVTYTVGEILQWSSNVGAVTIGQKMGPEDLYKWEKAFGFGALTGIDFPGESGGIVKAPEDWWESSIGNIPMGQGIAVTAMQMTSAFSTVAYNGWQVQPRLVAQVGTEVYDTVEKHRVLPGKVARQVREMLHVAVEEGTGTKARIPGYDVAGKTGTAEMALSDGSGYAKGIYTASFVGMAPADHPRLVVLVAVSGTPMYGGDAAAPAVKKIMQFSLSHLEIAP